MGSTVTRNEVDRRMFASSIDFEVKLQLIAFVQFAHARAFNRADMHECVGLAVITSDEAETLHGIEELDGSRGAFARQLALRSCRARFDRDNVANNLQVGSRNFSTAINQIEFQLLSFGKAFQPSAFYCADVHEHIFAAIFTLNEAEALLAVEKLYNAFAGADDLSRHSAATAATWATETAAARAAWATIATAETATITAETTAITEATPATAEIIATETAAAVGIKTFFAETVPLIASAAPPPSVKTHINQ